MRRARVVSEPVTDYIRYEHDLTFANVAAGELVRWLPRRNAADIAVSASGSPPGWTARVPAASALPAAAKTGRAAPERHRARSRPAGSACGRLSCG